MYRLRCPACGRRGASGRDRREIQILADTHNALLHRGEQVATVMRKRPHLGFSRRDVPAPQKSGDALTP